MRKQEYIDIGIDAGLHIGQIEQVLCSVLEISKTQLFSVHEISSKYIYDVQQMFYKMKSGESQEYLLETANFYGRDFFVDQRVLIPRNDTEVLVTNLLKKIHEDIDISSMVYIDVGTGSGCIPISIVLEMQPLKFEHVFALELSEPAMDVAIENIEKLAPGRIELRQSDLLSAIFHDDFRGKKLCISANLPYIKDADYENMDESVVRNEPNTALYGGSATGFEMYQALIKQCFQIGQVQKLREIHLFIEIGFDQRECSEAFLREMGLSFEYFPDSSNIERVIYITGF